MSDAEYRKCLKRERDRERKRRKSRQGGFESSILSFDNMPSEMKEGSAWLSDQGAGAEKVYAALDGETPETVYARRLAAARQRLRRAHPELVEVFNLIVKNGSNRKESIWALMSRNRGNGTPQKSVTGFS